MPSSTLQLIQATEPKYMAQVLAAVAVSLGPFASGLGKGYSSPALASLQKPWSNVTDAGAATVLATSSSTWDNFSVSQQEGSWIASLSLLGALFGGPMGGFLIRYGRKRTLLSVSLPFAGCWLMTVFASCVAMMYVTAFACGFCSALVLLVTHVYISEIAAPEVRGRLCALAKAASHIGLLVSFTLGAYFDWRRLAMVAATAPAMLFIAAWYVPETPSYLLLRGREAAASAALQWLRGSQVDISTELLTIQANLQEKHSRSASQRSICHQRRLYKPILITCGTMVFQRLSGAHAFSFYAVPIFRATFKDMDPHAAAIAVGFFQLFGAVTSGLLVDTVGRLPLLVASNFFMAIALGAFGTFVYWHGNIALDGSAALLAQRSVVLPVLPVSAQNVDWIPLVCVIIFTIAFSIGVGPIAWLLISELFPLEFRGLGGAIATSFSYACAFVSVKTFVDFEAALGLHGAFWLYAVVSFVGLVFVLTCVPETRGKGLDEMEFKMVVRH